MALLHKLMLYYSYHFKCLSLYQTVLSALHILSSQQPCEEVRLIFIPILQMRLLRPEE